MPTTNSVFTMRISNRIYMCSVATALLGMSTTAIGQERNMFEECSEIAHRIACHSISGACITNEPNETFEKRDQLEIMIRELCNNGPKNFSKFYWIDVHGTYRPYYTDKDGKTVKFPPKQK